ncbi:MAG: hypothetical protein GX548_08625, partial [Lentisphaerae bacterium]|nr:hypothetical protein [Lentisphaerota bacterium]
SDYYGVMMPGWNRKYARARYRESKWHVMGMYPPEYLADADSQLASAERRTKDPDVKARLHLLRIEFDYLRGLSRIFHLHSAWLLNRAPEYLNPLVDAIDEWHAELRRLSGEDGRSAFKPLDDWPEMRPFNGHHYSHAALLGDAYQQQWRKACINWDTAAIRAGILTAERRLPVSAVAEEPGLDAAAWEQAPEQVLRVRGDMPFTNVRTTFRALRDAENLYVRLECLFPSKHPEDLFAAGRDGNVFKEDHVELGIQPPGAAGKVFRLAANPAQDSCYDAVLTPAARNRTSEDKAWNGDWSFAFKLNIEKGRWNQSGRIYTAWFKIPFADLGATPPAAGEVWGFNVLRDRAGQRMLWNDGPGAADPASLGQLAF